MPGNGWHNWRNDMIAEGFLLGISTGTSCLLVCLPLLLPLLLQAPRGAGASARMIAWFLSGRLGAYLAAGAILGLAGVYVSGYVEPGLQRLLGGLAWTVGGGVLLYRGLRPGPGHSASGPRAAGCVRKAPVPANATTAATGTPAAGERVAVRAPAAAALATGFTSGFALCPPFVAASARVFGLGQAMHPGFGNAGAGLSALASGMGYFLCFFAGTALFFLPLAGLGFMGKVSPALAVTARTTTILLGVYFLLVQGLFRLAGVA